MSQSAPTLIHRPQSFVEPLPVRELFPLQQPLEVELGSGDGSFLAQYAGARPDLNFFGVERLLGRLRKLDRKGLRGGLQNLRLVRIEAGYFIEFLLPRNTAQAIHIYFPDPWPKRKHRKNRLINDRFPILASHALRPEGVVYLRTDDADYFSQMNDVFSSRSQFHRCETPAALSAIHTDFERSFHAKGIPTLITAYQRL